MRDYSNMPFLDWKDPASAKKAMAQIHHAEPVIIGLPKDYLIVFDADACGCTPGDSPSHLIDCHAAESLKALAERNDSPELARLAKIAHEAGQVVDIETDNRRIIIHD